MSAEVIDILMKNMEEMKDELKRIREAETRQDVKLAQLEYQLRVGKWIIGGLGVFVGGVLTHIVREYASDIISLIGG